LHPPSFHTHPLPPLPLIHVLEEKSVVVAERRRRRKWWSCREEGRVVVVQMRSKGEW
jgi:hypothetical protein